MTRTTSTTDTTSTRARATLAAIAIAAVVLVAGCSGETGSGSGGSGSSPAGSNYGAEELNNDYFNGCEWAEGCGMSSGAFSGSESNTLTGGNEIDPLSP